MRNQASDGQGPKHSVTTQRIRTCLWFDDQAEQAVAFYTGLFEDSEVLEVYRYTDVGPGEAGSVMLVSFRLAGHDMLALNGGPVFTFSEAVSLSVECADQAEIDRLWQALTDGGEDGQCGWLKDRYGLSWQLVPREMVQLLDSGEPARITAMTRAMMGMRKLDVRALREAFEAEPAAAS